MMDPRDDRRGWLLHWLSSAASSPPLGPGWAGVRSAAPTFCAVVLPLVFAFWLLRLVLPGDEFGIDLVYLQYPTYHWTKAQLLSGQLPLWNPYQLCGVPTLATLQGGIFYPPHVLYLLLPTHLAMAVSSFIHIAFAAMCMAVFGARVGLAWGPALLAGVLMGLRGSQPGHIFNATMLESGAWMCAGFIAALEIARGRRLAGAIGLAGVTAMSLLAGFPQLTIYSAYGWLFVVLGLVIADRNGVRDGSVRIAAAVSGILLGALIAAIQLLPALELAGVGARERGALPVELMYPFGLMGYGTARNALMTALMQRPATPDLFLSFGIATLALASVALFHRRQRGLVIVTCLLALLTSSFAMGPATPLFDLYLRLPELASFRVPSRILMLTDFCFALAAAIGLDWLLRRTAALGSTAAPSKRRGLAAPIVLCTALALVLLEIFTASPNRFELPYRDDNAHVRAYSQERVILDAVAHQPDRIWSWARPDADHFPWKAPSLFGIRSIADYDIMFLRRQAEYFSYLMWGSTTPLRRTASGIREDFFYGRLRLLGSGADIASVLDRIRLAELASARHILVPRVALAQPAVAEFLRQPHIQRRVVPDASLVLFENERALPRAHLTHHVVRAPDTRELLDILSRPDFDPRSQSYVEYSDRESGGPDAASSLGFWLAEPEEGDRRLEFASIVRDELHEVEVSAGLAAPGLLILADSYAPGWTATVDGDPADILPTNHLFRGVPLPAGEHTVVFRYQPRSVALGAAGSGLGLAVLAGLIAYDWRLSRRPRR